jgi:multidrug efflux pump subunit AcrB
MKADQPAAGASGNSSSPQNSSHSMSGSSEIDQRHPVGRLAAYFYHDKRLTLLTLLLVMASGLSSLLVLPRREDPLLRSRAAQVTTLFPGANAEKVESQVTEQIETRLREVSEIKRLRSQSRAGVSFISIELRDEITEPDRIWPEIRGKIEDSIADLPSGAARPQFDTMEISAYAWIGGITWYRDDPASYGVMRRLALELRDQLLSVPGTKMVDLFGDPKEEILVELDPSRLTATGISPALVADRLRQADVKSSSGMLRSGVTETVVQFRNEFNSLEDIANTALDNSQPGYALRLRDIATLRRGIPDPASTLAIIDERPSVVLGVLLRDEQRIDLWAKNAAEVLTSFDAQLPEGIRLDVIMQQERFVSERISKLLMNLTLGILAVSATTFLLLGWRSSLLVTATLPIASLMVLTGMRMLDIPIHQMSVTGLIIALGLLIDNAIIAADEVEISLRRGMSPMDAARDMVTRLFGPLLASTLTTAFAFAPIALMEGPSGEFVGSIAWTVLLAVFSSLFLSMTILPSTAAWLQQRVAKTCFGESERFHFLRQTLRHGVSFPRLTRVYRRFLEFILRRPWVGIGFGVALPAAGFLAATQLSEQFFPPADRSQFHIELELESQASMAKTQATVSDLDQWLKQEPRVKQTAWFFGESAPTFYYNVISRVKNSPNFAQAIVNLDSERDSGSLIRRLQTELDLAFPDARILVRQLEQGPPFDAPVELRIFGPDIERLNELGEQIRLAAVGLPDVIHTKTILSESRPMAQVLVDSQQAGWAGLTERDIADQLFSRLEGLPAGLLIEQTEQIPVRVRVAGQRNTSLNSLRETGLMTSASIDANPLQQSTASSVLTSVVPISTVADIRLSPQRAVIARYDGVRMNELKAYLRAESLPSKTVERLKAAMSEKGISMPIGYHMEFGGEADERNSAVQRLMANVSILVVGMLAAMVLALASFRLAGLIGFVAMLAVGLGLGALWVFGYPFGFMAIIGTMGLIGIAINDSIVVVAALKRQGESTGGEISSMVDTVVEVTRHVLATTATTMAGFMPLMLDGGAFWPPLAVAIGGGVVGATLISLTLVPSAMQLLYFRRSSHAASGVPQSA